MSGFVSTKKLSSYKKLKMLRFCEVCPAGHNHSLPCSSSSDTTEIPKWCCVQDNHLELSSLGGTFLVLDVRAWGSP